MTDSADEPRDREQPHRARDERTGHDASATRMLHQARWVDLQIQQAVERGDFDDLPGAGKPLGDLGSAHDRDWWLRRLIEREQITGVLPPALELRNEDARLDDVLDRETAEQEVRRLLEEFNRRVVEARRQLQGGPPVVTPTRDVEAEIGRWRERSGAAAAARRTPSPPVRKEAQRTDRSPKTRRRFGWRRD